MIDQNKIAALLDQGEYLPGLVLEPEDRTTTFDEHLASIARDAGGAGVAPGPTD